MTRTLVAAAIAVVVSGGAALAAQSSMTNAPASMNAAYGQGTAAMRPNDPGQSGFVAGVSAFPQGDPLGEYTVRAANGAIGEFAPSDSVG